MNATHNETAAAINKAREVLAMLDRATRNVAGKPREDAFNGVRVHLSAPNVEAIREALAALEAIAR